jgi:hypothetical protein
MVGMISCVVLVWLRANRSDDKETLLKLFSGADPINFPCFNGLPLEKVGRPSCGGGESRLRRQPDKPYFEFFLK